jgi:DNA primase
MKSIDEAQKWVSSKDQSSGEAKVTIIKPEIKSPKIFNKSCLSKLVSNHTYWLGRGISEDTISQFQGGIIGEGKMKNRYVFPIFDAKDRLVGVSGRYTLPIKYDSIPKWKHIGDKYAWKYPLFLNHERILEKKEVFLVESIGDMLSLWEAGYKNSIVTFGLDISSSIMGVLLRFDLNKIYISFNNDSDKNSRGNLAAKKAQQKLLRHFDPNQVEVKLPSKNDFGDMNTKEIQTWVKQNTYQRHE